MHTVLHGIHVGDASVVLQHRARHVGAAHRARRDADGLAVQARALGTQNGGNQYKRKTKFIC